MAKRSALALLAAALALLAACSGPASGPPGGPGATSTRAPATSNPSDRPVRVGLAATPSGGAAAAGEAMQRGMQLAIDEANGAGGIKGRPLELVVRDDEGNPAKGAANVRELVEREGAVAVFADQQTAVALAQADVAQQLGVPLMVAWASGARVVQPERQPSFAFRVAANDATVDPLLASYVAGRLGRKSPAVLVDGSVWGESNGEALAAGLTQAGAKPAAVDKLGPTEGDVAAALARARDAGADALVLVADTAEGARTLRGLATLGLDARTLPVVTHGDVTAGPFAQAAGVENTNDVRTLQTYSFFGELSIPGKRALAGYLRKYGGKGPEDVAAPTGVAQAFDALHLLARGLRQVDDPRAGDAVRQALENLDQSYDGVLKTYQRPFSAQSHEALGPDDYLIAVWQDGQLLPERAPRN